MLTKSSPHHGLTAATAQAPDEYSWDAMFTMVGIEGKEVTISLFSTLYGVIRVLRNRGYVKVYVPQGRVVFEHDGVDMVTGEQRFVMAISAMEFFMLEEQKLGFDRAQVHYQSPAQTGIEDGAGSPHAESSHRPGPDAPASEQEEGPQHSTATDEGVSASMGEATATDQRASGAFATAEPRRQGRRRR